MKIFENRTHNGRSRACGYCRQLGHNRTECPEVEKDWAYFQDFQIPPNRGVHTWYRSRTNPKYWGEWYQDCKNTRLKQLDAKAKKITRVKRSAPKCGFCGSPNHNRRNCDLMKSFLADCYKANENWRKVAYKILVEEHGIDVGAAVQVSERPTYWNNQTPESNVGLITSINWDNLNVMTAFQGCWDHGPKYGQPTEISVMVNGQDQQLSLKTMLSNTSLREIISDRNASKNYYYSNVSLDKVIGRSEHPLKEEWITSYKDAFDYLCKKLSFEQLKDRGVYGHIQDWANRS